MVIFPGRLFLIVGNAKSKLPTTAIVGGSTFLRLIQILAATENAERESNHIKKPIKIVKPRVIPFLENVTSTMVKINYVERQ